MKSFLIYIGFIISGVVATTSFTIFSNSTAQEEASTFLRDAIVEVESDNISINISVVGDVMFHTPQITACYDAVSKTYNFKPFFDEVKPFFKAADLAIANFETTTAGPSRPYSGYPNFNSPDEAFDALIDAGIDVITTVNNHCLDTGEKGLRRTAQKAKEKGLDFVGTYESEATVNNRFIVKDVKGIKIAILAYTEHANGIEKSFTPEKQYQLLNLMDKEQVAKDIKAAKDQQVDAILACLHWGDEYQKEPAKRQVDFANCLANEGVDFIMGSHPHVIQKSDFIQTEDKRSFVIYSMGNFISNQRRETLGANFGATETGVIVNLHVQKVKSINKTTLENVDYIPTWVYRKKEDKPTWTYRVLPIAKFMNSSQYDSDSQKRMNEAWEYTMPMLKKMQP